MKNYRMPNLTIKEAIAVLEQQKTTYKFIEDISKHPLFKKITGSLDKPKITILNDVEIANSAIAGIVNTKKPQIIDCDFARIETEYNNIVVMIANVAKQKEEIVYTTIWQDIKAFFKNIKNEFMGVNLNANYN